MKTILLGFILLTGMDGKILINPDYIVMVKRERCDEDAKPFCTEVVLRKDSTHEPLETINVRETVTEIRELGRFVK